MADFEYQMPVERAAPPRFAVGKETGSLYVRVNGGWVAIIGKNGVRDGDLTNGIDAGRDLMLPPGTKIIITA